MSNSSPGPPCPCPLGEDLGNQLAIQALERQFPPEGLLAARPGSIPRLDPGAAESPVVQHPQLEKPGDGAFDQLGGVSRGRQVAADLVNRAGPKLQEAGRGVEDYVRVLDGGMALETPPSRLEPLRSAAPWHAGLFGLFDPFDGQGDLGHLAPDLLLDLGRDVRVALEELLGGLAALAQAGLAEGEPGAGLG